MSSNEWSNRAGAGILARGAPAIETGRLAAWLAILGLLERLIAKYRFAPLWAEGFRNQLHFYHLRLLDQYPLFWPLTPLALLAGLAAWPRPAAFCVCVFGTAFTLASFAGMKDDRYLFFALPFLFALWGIGFAATFDRLRSGLARLIEAARARAVPRLPARPTHTAAAAAVLGFMLLSSGAPARLANDFATGDAPSGPGRVTPDWAGARAALAPWPERAGVVAVSNELAALRHLGRADVVISGSRLSELHGAEFGRDPRTGVTVVGGPAAVRELVACHADGLVVLSTRDLAFDWAVPPATRAAIAAVTSSIPLPGLAELRAYRWRTEEPRRTGCPAIGPTRQGD